MSDSDLEYKLAKLELEKAKSRLDEIKPKEPPFCSFCGRGASEYSHLIEGKRTTKICDCCVYECLELLKEKTNT